MPLENFKIINPATIKRRVEKEMKCEAYNDAPVCHDGTSDVDCTGERYRGCQPGETDCANNPGNPDDSCCAGWGPGPGDNIDHQWCGENDAGWGGTCFIFDSGNPPPGEENRDV